MSAMRSFSIRSKLIESDASLSLSLPLSLSLSLSVCVCVCVCVCVALHLSRGYCERTQVGAGATSFLEEISKAASRHGRDDFAAMVATVPDIVKPTRIPRVLPSLAVIEPTSYLVDHLGTYQTAF
eukprot:COSAG02_NODE_1341_length_13172_cov_324.630001_6_plen_125_part_00